METFNQSLSNSIINPVETESFKKQNKVVSFKYQQNNQQEGARRQESALMIKSEAGHQRSQSTSRELSSKR
jgi:hypothetical protein